MNTNPINIYQKIKEIDDSVKKTLKSKGLVVPKKYSNGTIGVGSYKIVKDDNGFYNILDYAHEPVVKQINLPQTAAILANKLALGKLLDEQILTADRKYGHAFFEEKLQNTLFTKNLKRNKIEAADLMLIKARISTLKKEHYKKEIVRGFDKLLAFR